MQRNPSSRKPPVQRMAQQQRKVVTSAARKFQPKQPAAPKRASSR